MRFCKILVVGALLGFCCVFSVKAQKKQVQKCDSSVTGGKYDWVGIAPLLKEPDHLFGSVLVKPKNINRDYLIQLARRLKSEYCSAQEFQVVIFDNSKYANSYSIQDYTSSGAKIILMRGFYSFDRKTGKDLLEFSTKPGNVTTEVQIDLSSLN